MKKYLSKKVWSFIFAGAIMMSLAIPAFAASTSFSSKYVDSNTWGSVTGAKKGTYSTNAQVKITAIYAADGTDKGYSQVRIKAMSNGTSKTVTKGIATNITIPADYRDKGDYVSMYAMGNKPDLDCKISGNWNVY